MKRFELYTLEYSSIEKLMSMGVEDPGDPKCWKLVKQHADFEGRYKTDQEAFKKGQRCGKEYIVYDSVKKYAIN